MTPMRPAEQLTHDPCDVVTDASVKVDDISAVMNGWRISGKMNRTVLRIRAFWTMRFTNLLTYLLTYQLLDIFNSY